MHVIYNRYFWVRHWFFSVQFFYCFRYNLASISLRFRSLSVTRFEELFQYNNFHFLGNGVKIHCFSILNFFKESFKEKTNSSTICKCIWRVTHFCLISVRILVDIGSTLGLYFGMTILTVFELVIFVFYRSAADPFRISHMPSKSVIYGISAKKLNSKYEIKSRSRTHQALPILFLLNCLYELQNQIW